MVDLSKVSEWVIKAVADIAAFGGKTGKIDKGAEKNALSVLLSGCDKEEDKEYIQGFMIEKGHSKKVEGARKEVNTERRVDVKPKDFDNTDYVAENKDIDTDTYIMMRTNYELRAQNIELYFDENGRIKGNVVRDGNNKISSYSDFEYKNGLIHGYTKSFPEQFEVRAIIDPLTNKPISVEPKYVGPMSFGSTDMPNVAIETKKENGAWDTVENNTPVSSDKIYTGKEFVEKFFPGRKYEELPNEKGGPAVYKIYGDYGRYTIAHIYSDSGNYNLYEYTSGDSGDKLYELEWVKVNEKDELYPMTKMLFNENEDVEYQTLYENGILKEELENEWDGKNLKKQVTTHYRGEDVVAAKTVATIYSEEDNVRELPENLKNLKPDGETASSNGTWSVTYKIPSNEEDVKYRYAEVYYNSDDTISAIEVTDVYDLPDDDSVDISPSAEGKEVSHPYDIDIEKTKKDLAEKPQNDSVRAKDDKNTAEPDTTSVPKREDEVEERELPKSRHNAVKPQEDSTRYNDDSEKINRSEDTASSVYSYLEKTKDFIKNLFK